MIIDLVAIKGSTNAKHPGTTISDYIASGRGLKEE